MENASISNGAVETGAGHLKLLPIIVVVTLFTAVSISKPLFSNRALEAFYESQPCPSRKQQWFSWLRATMRSFTDTSDRVAEGYAKYSKSNIAFLVPNLRKGPVLALPPSQLKAVFGNPEHKLAAHAPQFENISAKYTMGDPAIYPSNYEIDVVQKQITRKYGTVTHELAEELSLAFDEYWGMAEEWHDVLAWESLQKIAARGVNRVAVGLPLCRNEKFLDRTRHYAMSIPRDGLLIGLMPSFLKPLLAPLITWPGRNDCTAGIQACVPLVQERLQEYLKKKAEPDYDWLPPNDVLQWIIEESNASGKPEHMKPKRIAHRLVMYNFNSVPPIGLTLANLLFDLYSETNAEQYVARLQEESR